MEQRSVIESPPQVVWDILSDTDHLNRFLKFPRVQYQAADQTSGAIFRVATASLGMGLQMRWQEFPFEWVRGESYNITRKFIGGPLEEISLGIRTSPHPKGCELIGFIDVTARWAWLRPVLLLWGRNTLNAFLRYCQNSIARVKEQPTPLYTPLPLTKPKNPDHLHSLIADISDKFKARFSEEVSWSKQLSEYLCEGSDRQVLNLRPFEIARNWNLPKDQAIRFFLFATERGAFELDWQLQCPNCRVSKDRTSSLRTLADSFHCDLCGIDFETDLAESVELRFRIHPRLRTAHDEAYCLMGPYQSRHIRKQVNLAPGAKALVSVFNDPNLRVRVIGKQEKATKASTPLAPAQMRWNGTGWLTQNSGQSEIINDGPKHVTIVVEEVQRDPDIVSAAYVTSLQSFRKLFGAEVLSVGASVAVKHLSFLFSDLKDSTALYQKVGDAVAFSRVQKHFSYLEAHLEKFEGALVKTMGDAIMAVFSDPQQALDCALAMQEELNRFNAQEKIEPPIVLKLGLHCGPSIAIENEGKIDYFGATVNYSARIQAQSVGGDIVLSSDFAQVAIGLPSLAPRWNQSSFVTELKGIGREQCLRLVPASTRPSARKAS
jgi:adenylate cyclase